MPILRCRLLYGSDDGESGGCLVVSTGRNPGSSRALRVARNVPAEAGRLAVVMRRATTERMPALAQRLRRWIPERWDSIRLVAGRAAVSEDAGSPAAQELAELLGVEVLAPEGDLVVVPGGSLFVVDWRNQRGRAGWVRFRPFRSPLPAGRRVPAPEWESDLNAFGDPAIAGLVVEEVPAGLWVHLPESALPDRAAVPDQAAGIPAGSGPVAADRDAVVRTAASVATVPGGPARASLEGDRVGPVRAGADLAFAVPADASTMALVVSRPGDPGLPSAKLRQLVEALPDSLRDRLAVIPYGDRAVADGHLGALVSLAANRTVRVRNGMPLHLPGRGRQIVAVGPDGVPTWCPFAHDLVWRPHGGARIVSWAAPVDHLLPVAPGQLAIDERWLVEVIEAGLWIRETNAGDPGGVVRGLPLDSQHCAVVVGVSEADQVQPPWRAISKLLQGLPADARCRVRLTIPWSAGDWIVRAATKSCARALNGAPVWLLAADGTCVPQRGLPA
jgi:hypothetical protein